VDVAGEMDVAMPVASVLVTIPRIGLNELADAPLQRSGPLYRQQNVVIDSRLTGTRPDGTTWVGSPLLDASGYVNSIPLTSQQQMPRGGNLPIGGITAAQQDSVINIAGGYTSYEGGLINTTKLISADGGRIVDIGAANPNALYSGVLGTYTLVHSRWGVTQS